ncbi:LA_2272 family surface repeat-containing protein [Elusimicrobiota bacterium]
MRKILSLSLVVMFFAVVSVYAGGKSPVKIGIITPIEIPKADVVHGVDLSMLGSTGVETQGLQLSTFFVNSTDKMVGYQSALVTKAGSMSIMQNGFVNLADEVTGVQIGFWNGSNMVSGVQLGVINITDEMKGVQIGLINVIKRGKLPFMVIANACFG